jgi:hypothetical protein
VAASWGWGVCFSRGTSFVLRASDNSGPPCLLRDDAAVRVDQQRFAGYNGSCVIIADAMRGAPRMRPAARRGLFVRGHHAN